MKLKKIEGKKHFRFFNDQVEMSMYDPLILVDWVAVNDINKILAMSPPAIERIELVNFPYIKGNIIYGGIISFVSKKNNFAGIDLPSSGTFVNYHFLQECAVTVPPAPSNVSLPDPRNTVYWNPDLRVNKEGKADVSFKTPDTPGKYDIILRLINLKGEVVVTKKQIEVK